MIKKIGLLSVILVAFSLLLFACKKPYENFNLAVSDSEVVLYLKSGSGTLGGEGQTPAEGEEENVLISSKEITATVTGGDKGVGRNVNVSQVGNAVTIGQQTRDGNATKFTLTAKEAGRSVITVNTTEGNKHKQINVIVYKAINSVSWKNEQIAISTTQKLKLNNYLNFNPSDTNQKEMNFYINDVNALGLELDSLNNITKTTYAQIVNGELQILNMEEAPFNYEGLYHYVPVVAYSPFNPDIKTVSINVPIVNFVSRNEIKLFTNTEEGEVQLQQNALSEYEIILGSNITDNANIFSRNLIFRVGDNISVDKNYRVSLIANSLSQTNIVQITERTNHVLRKSFDPSIDNINSYVYNNFLINQINDGEVNMTFKVEVYGFEGVFVEYFNVKVTVKSFPKSITVTDRDGNAIQNGSSIVVYNQYGGNLIGAYLKVLALPEVAGLTFSVRKIDAGNLIVKNSNQIVIANESVKINNGENLYLTHEYTDNLPTNSRLVIVFTYTLAPLSASGEYVEYKLEHEINIEYKIGLSDITVPNELLINAANKSLILTPGNFSKDIILVSTVNATVNLFDSISSISILSVDGVLVRNIPNFNLNPISNQYYTIDYDTAGNVFRLNPNNEGLSVRMRLRIATHNGLERETNLIIFVPLVYEDHLSPYVEVPQDSSIIFYSEQRGYNVSILEDETLKVKLARDEEGSYYDENGIKIIEATEDSPQIGGDPLEITYVTTSFLNMKTNSSLTLNFYNYLLKYDENNQNAQIVRINYNKDVIINNYSQDYFAIETNTVTGEKVLRTKYLQTNNAGLTLTINFNGYDNNGAYVTYKFILTVVITRPLESISISPRSGTLYEKSSVGSLNYLSSEMAIAVSGYPITQLVEENNIHLNIELQNEFIYDYYVQLNHLDTGFTAKKQSILNYILNNDIYYMNITENGLVTVSFSSYDIAVLSPQNVLTAQLQQSLFEKIKLIFKLKYNIDLSIDLETITYSKTELSDLQNEVINSLFSNVIRVRVYATAVQFNSLPVYAYNEIQIKYALKVNNIIINNVDNDGIYFDLRNDTKTKVITLYTLPTNATNKNLTAYIGDNTVARISRESIHADGVIIGNSITIERLSAGTTTILIAAQDSYVQELANGVLVSRPTLYIELRIKVADGSEANPFEIRSVADFLNIKNYNLNYHYVLARDINLSGITNYAPIANFAGGLNGLFTYYNTGVYYSIQNTIYGLTIHKTVELPNHEFGEYEDYNYGLFSNLTQSAVIKNLVLKDVNIQINFNKTVASVNNQDYNKELNVGAIAGVSRATILNPVVSGKITVTTNVDNVNIGGAVGIQYSNYNAQTDTLSGYIGSYEGVGSSFNNETVNSSVVMKLISKKDINNFNTNKNLGGLVGKSANNEQTNKILLQVNNNAPAISNIQTNVTISSVYIDSETSLEKTNSANAGGVVGYAHTLYITDVVVTPFIFAYNNIGGIAGYAEYSFVYNAIVQMYDLGYVGLQATNLVGYNTVGGLVGVGKNVSINYSYVRSYYNKTIDNITFAGNLVLLNGENDAETKLYIGGLIGYAIDGIANTELFVHEGILAEDYTPPSANHIQVTDRSFKNEIKNSYFNAEINTNYHLLAGDLNVGGLVGGTVNENERSLYIENSYVMANIMVQGAVTSEPIETWVDLEEGFAFGTVVTKEIMNNKLVTTTTSSVSSAENIREKLDEDGQPVIIDDVPVYEIKVTTTTVTQKLFGLFTGNEKFSLTNTKTGEVVTENEEQQLTTTTQTFRLTLSSSLHYTQYGSGVGAYFAINTVAKTSYALVNNNYSDKMFGIISSSYDDFVSFNILYEDYNVITTEQLGVINRNSVAGTFSYEQNVLQNYENFDFNIISSTSDDTYYRIEIYDANDILIDTIYVREENIPSLSEIQLSYPTAAYIFAYESTTWVIYENLNNDYPILLNADRSKLLYKVLPSNMQGTVLEFDGSINPFNNLAYVKVEDQKAVLFYNKITSGTPVSSVNKYRIVKTGDVVQPSEINNVIEVNLNVNLNANSRYQPEIDGNLIITSSNINVIRVLAGGIIETVGAGTTTLTIAAKLNRNISTTVEILVVSGVSHFNLYYNSNTLNSENVVFATETVFVDQTRNFYLDSINIYSKLPNYAVYENNANIGVLVSVSSANIGSVMLNNELLETGKNYVYNTLNEFNLKGVDIGFVTLSVTPFIKTNNSSFGTSIVGDNVDSQGNPMTLNNVVLLNLLNKTYSFNVSPKASAIHTNNKLSATLSPQQTTDITVSVKTSNINKAEYELNGYLTQSMINEQIILRIYNSQDNSLLASITNVGAGMDAGGFNNSLLTYTLVAFHYAEVVNADGEVLEYEVSYTLRFSFDKEKYRGTLTGVTYNLNELNYSLVFTPSSNNEISAHMNVNIVPNNLTNITASFYAGNEITIIGNQSAFNPQEAATDYIAPGKMGLLKLYLFPEFNNAEFVELTINEELKNYVNFDQMLEIYAEDESSNVVGYTETGQGKLLLDNNTGIRLRNLSLTTHGGLEENFVYNGSYFVRVLLSALVPIDTQVVFTITAYNMVNGNKNYVLSENITLTVQPLPTISLSYKGANAGVMAVGTTIALDLQANNFENIVMTATPEFGSLSTVKIIHDELTNQYFLQVLDNATLGGRVFVTARASRFINGMEEFSESTVTITVVEFIIDSVRVNGTSSANFGTNTFEILNGTNNELSVSVNAEYSKTAVNGTLDINKLVFENMISGKVVSPTNNDFINNWYLQRTVGGVTTLEKLVHNNIYGNTFKFSRVTDLDNSLNTYWAISGMRVNSGTYTIVYKLQYYYNTLGVATPYTNEQGVTVYETNEFAFVLIIKDNSTYDHPNPIEKVEDFLEMQPGVHYILTQDIVLNNYIPRDAEFASLDGNGYVIHINSFNFANDKANNATSVTTGMFKTVSSNTIIKNLTINISSLLITRSQVNVLNATTDPTVQNTAKINLYGVTNVTFGILAGVNNGTLTNIKIVNLDNSDPAFNNKLLFVYTTQGYYEGNEVMARIGTVVGINNGSISNSYVGQNYYELNAYDASRIRRVIDDAIQNVPTYSYAVVGGKQIAGFVFANEGTITNSYNKEVGVVNISAIFNESKTAGFVIENSGIIYSAFVEGSEVTNFRASEKIYLEGKGSIGGFVYENASVINNAYANITIKTNSGNSGGFVYRNLNTGVISNAYAAGNNYANNSLSHGLFTGVNEVNTYNNLGKLDSAFYLIFEHEIGDVNEPANPIVGNTDTSTEGANPFRYEGSFSQFSFTSSNDSENGIWVMNAVNGNYGPQLANSIHYNTFSHRTLVSKDTPNPAEPEEVIYNYIYDSSNTYDYGEKNNPILINTATDFVTIVIENSKTYTYQQSGVIQKMHIFGVNDVSEAKSYVRLVNNLNFSEVVLNSLVVNNLRISDITFAGILDGNGMNMTGITLTDLKKDEYNENYGFFTQIGLSNAQFENFINKGGTSVKHQRINPSIKNLTLSIGRFDATNSSKVGALAGSIYDANLINLTLNGANNVFIQGRHLVGGYAGLIQYESDGETAQRYSLINLKSNNIWVYASYSNVNLLDSDVINDNGIAERTIGTVTTAIRFSSYKHDGTNVNQIRNYSYAGSIAGVLVGNNRLEQNNSQNVKQGSEVGDGITSNDDINKHRSTQVGLINNIVAGGGGRVIGAHVGGLFGYVGENTHIIKASFIVENTTSGDAQLLSGTNYTGGIVGENYGMLEKVYVEHNNTVVGSTGEGLQTTYDKNIANGLTDVYGIKTLFGTGVSIAVGGIAGYSDNSIILDSYVKVSVINPYAKIAGGLIGIATRKNYISHTYVTNDVLGKYIFGGIVGLYNQSGKNIITDRGKIENRGSESDFDPLKHVTSLTSTDKIYLDYVVALNTWGAGAKTALENNLRQYYRNYSNDGGNPYRSFNLVFSEVGNQAPSITAIANIKNINTQPFVDKIIVDDKEITIGEETEYQKMLNSAITPSVYMGSLVGRVTLGKTESSDGYSSSNTKLLNKTGLYKALVESRNSDLLQTKGDNQEVIYESTVVSTTFAATVASLNTNKVYEQVGDNLVETQIREWPRMNAPSVKGNIIRYENVVGQQLYNLALVGKQDARLNYFRMWIIDQENLSDFSINDDSKVWKISSNGVLPEYIVGIYSNYVAIDSDEKFEKLIINNNTASQYFVLKQNTTPGSDGKYNISSISGNNLFIHTFKGVLIGEEKVFGNEIIRPEVIVEYRYSSNIRSIFSKLDSATISNINFTINIVVSGDTDAYRSLIIENNVSDNGPTNSINAGLFARNVSSSVLSNINITITSNYNPILKPVATIRNFGLIFGAVSYGTISNFNVHMLTSFDYRTEAQTTFNYISGFAALVENSFINNINVYAQNKNLSVNTANLAVTNAYVSAFIAYATDTRIYNINSDVIKLSQGNENRTNLQLQVLAVNSKTRLRAGGILGYGIGMELIDVSYFGNLTVGTQSDTPTVVDAYVGNLVGYLDSNSQVENAYSNSRYLNGVYTLNKDIGGNLYMLSVNASGDMYVGGLIGYSSSSTMKTTQELTNSTNNSSKIMINGTYTTLKNLHIGGIVGYTISPTTISQNQGAFNVFNAGDIDVTISGTRLPNVYVGGIAGTGNGIVLEHIYNYGNLTINTPGTFAVGGIVGNIINESIIRHYAMYGDIRNSDAVNLSTTRTMGGVFGKNVHTLTVEYGISLARMYGVNISSESGFDYARGIGYGNLITSNSNYFVYEFAPYDNVNAISYIQLGELNSNGTLIKSLPGYEKETITTEQKLGEMFVNSGGNESLRVPYLANVANIKDIDAQFNNALFGTSRKLNPTTVTNISSHVTNMNGYYLLESNLTGEQTVIDTFNGVLMGKPISIDADGDGYPTITLSSDAPFINTNNGVVANISVKTRNHITNESAYFVNTNGKNGIIINSTVYGQISANGNDVAFAGFVWTNSGKIIHSASSITFNNNFTNSTGTGKGFAGLVFNNLAGALVKESYSTSALLNSNNLNLGLLIYNNQGRIYNSYFGGYYDGGVTNAESVIFNTTGGTSANNVFDMNADKSTRDRNGVYTSYLQGYGSGSEWLAEKNKNIFKTTAYVESTLDYNYGYPVIKNAIALPTAATVTYNDNINSNEYLKISNILLYQTPSSSTFIPLIHGGMLTQIVNIKDISYRGFLLLDDIDLSYFKLNKDTPTASIGSLANLNGKVFLGNEKTIFHSQEPTKSNINLTNGYLFEQISNSSVGYLKLKNFTAKIAANDYIGILASKLLNSSVNHIEIDNFIVEGKENVGALAGSISYNSIGTYKISNVTVNNSNGVSVVYGNSSNVGGIVGYISGHTANSKVEFSGNVVNDIFVMSKAGGITGGIIGYGTKVNVINSSSVANKVNFESVSTGGKNYTARLKLNDFGGIAGKLEDSSLQNVYNTSNVYGNERIGGIVGHAISTSFSGYFGDTKEGGGFSSNHSTIGYKQVGGILGYGSGVDLKGGAMNQATNYGVVGFDGYASVSKIGGIVGELANNSSIENATSGGDIYGASDIGGIVGYTTNNVLKNFRISANIYYRGTGDIDGDVGFRKFKLGKLNNAMYDSGNASNYSYFGTSGSINSYKTGGTKYINREFGGLNIQSYSSYKSTTYKFSLGFIYGRASSTSLTASGTIEVVGGEASIKDLYDIYTYYEYSAKLVEEGGFLWWDKDYVIANMKATVSVRYYDSNNYAHFYYGNKDISKVSGNPNTGNLNGLILVGTKNNIASGRAFNNHKFQIGGDWSEQSGNEIYNDQTGTFTKTLESADYVK